MATAPADRHKGGVIIDLSFLDICNAHVRELYVYWDERRAGRAMPLRSDIDPAAFPRHLPGILLVDVRWEPMDFIYRVVGTREVEARGSNPTGKPVASHWFGGGRDRVLDNYRHVASKASHLYDYDPFRTGDGHFLIDESLFMPLSFGGARVDQILVYTHYEDLWRKQQA